MAISANNLLGSSNGTEKVIFGGTFDPVHNGHLISAQELAQKMAYQAITLMPCGQAYHKTGSSKAQHRLNMLNLAVSENSVLNVDDREVLRDGATYTVDTLRQIRRELGEHAHITWVMGTDSAQSIERWHQWQQIFTLASVIVIARAGEPELNLSHWPALQVENTEAFKQYPHGCYCQLALTPICLSSSEVRKAIKLHQPVDNHVPQAVIEYIEQHGLYRGLD